MDNDSRNFSRSKAISTLRDLLRLILAFYKDKKENNERTIISMCYSYFGLENADDMYNKKVPFNENVRFANIKNVQTKLTQDGVIQAKDAETLIKDHLSKMAHDHIKQVWNRHQQINKNANYVLISYTVPHVTLPNAFTTM